jgi:hypothetical protein
LSVLMLYVGIGNREPGIEPHAVGARLTRFDRLLVYLFAIAPPLHLSAMVAAPAAIAMATVDERLRVDVRRAVLLLGAALLSVGAGTGSIGIAAAGVLVVLIGSMLGRDRGASLRDAFGILALVAVAASAFAFLLLRARHDPAINQGDPDTITGVINVIARRQYDVPGLWPRRAPLWLQIGNLFQYVDWQFALGLDQWVGASWWRTPCTVVFLALGAIGSAWHYRRDRRTWFVVLVLVASATFGVAVYLNLKAGPSFGYGILPATADREARERDYFFALGFAAFGLWTGVGAVVAARFAAARAARPKLARAGVLLAAVPIALNWRATDRRHEPAASLPNAFARATLESVPPRAVLFVAGDNDTYPLWYAQTAQHLRPDVTIVTVPLLPAGWYRTELARRHRLYDPADTAGWRGTPGELSAIAARVERQGRPIAAAVGLEPELRAALGSRWSFRGLVYSRVSRTGEAETRTSIPALDSTAAMIGRLYSGAVKENRLEDPAGRYLTTLLTCPRLAKQVALGGAADSTLLLATRCNFR